MGESCGTGWAEGAMAELRRGNGGRGRPDRMPDVRLRGVCVYVRFFFWSK